MTKIEIVPSKKSLKLLGISLVIALILNIGEFLRIDGTPKLFAYFIDTLIYTVVVAVAIRAGSWLLAKIK